MPIGDISTTKNFINGQLGVDGSDLNAIIGQSSIQPAFISAQSVATSPGNNDQLILLGSGGAFYRILYSNFFNNIAAVRGSVGLVGPPNALVNGDMAVWQRNSSFPTLGSAGSTNSYTADRWKVQCNLASGVGTVSRLDLGGSLVGTANNPRPHFALRLTVTTAQASLGAGEFFLIAQAIELNELRRLGFLDQPSSLSLWIRTSVAGSFGVSIRDAGLTQYYKQTTSIGTPNSWTRIPIANIAAFPGAGNWGTNESDLAAYLSICMGCGTTFQSTTENAWGSGNILASANQLNVFATNGATVDICLVQLEPGNVCTPFYPEDLTANLGRCFRYRTQSYDLGTFPGALIGSPIRAMTPGAVSTIPVILPFPVPMRSASPTVVIYSDITGASGALRDITSAGDRAVTSANPVNTKGIGQINMTAAGIDNNILSFHYTADAEL